ncbi:MAG TPA: tRNA preQ1(34) S-adenosylmethionine ribosyltransferase-isomerase QueA [Pyrinomonadaceae bacterium]|nr:tRNA preQ1(34) S-adenosylmethionine ribosyltransferase-isomerase QueA [Pyrinomonadaceae bacterium]
MESLDDYEFDLPEELIAERPLDDRSASRMLAVDLSTRSLDDRRFKELPQILRSGDILVLNNTRVFPARLIGNLSTGARVEIFLVDEIVDGRWSALARPAKRLKPGGSIDFGGRLNGEVLEKAVDGRVVIEFRADGNFFDVLETIGRTPLPPYIKRNLDEPDTDRNRYQTVFARERGAIAAPTAGLHFTPEILAAAADRGIATAEVTLHVGYGTFEPIRVDDLRMHHVLPERYSVSDAAADLLNTARSEGRRVIAVGTTTTRTLESVLSPDGEFLAGDGLANLTILPGYRFRSINGLLTNFHLPRSSLLVLVSAFGGHELIMNAYRHAVRERYRFYSYGDCMLIV